ncbi:MAG: hypothetical protein AAB885_02865, partial [Patescibacteria group bacterium]
GFGFALFFGLRGERPIQGLRRLLAPLVAIFTIGTLIGILQLVPAYVVAQFSQRASGFGHTGYAIKPLELLNFFHLTPNRGLDAYLYMGMVAVLFLIFSFWIRKNQFVSFFRWVFLITLALSIQGSPLFGLLVKLPIFNMFQGAARFMLVGIFAAAVLVGFGFDYLMRLRVQDFKKVLPNLITVTGIIGIIFLTIIILHPKTVNSVLLSLIFLATAVLILGFVKNYKLAAAACISIAALEFILIFYRFNAPTMISRKIYEREPATVSFLRQYSNRLLPLFVDDWDDLYFFNFLSPAKPPVNDRLYEMSLGLKTYRPNFQLLYGVPNLEINDPLLNTNLARMLALLGTRQLAATGGEQKLDKVYVLASDGVDYSVREKYHLLAERISLTEFLGITHFFTDLPFNHPDFDPKIDLPIVGQALIPLIVEGSRISDLPALLYNNTGAKLPAYFASVSSYVNSDQEAYQAFKKSGFKGIFVECNGCPDIIKGVGGETEILFSGNGL